MYSHLRAFNAEDFAVGTSTINGTDDAQFFKVMLKEQLEHEIRGIDKEGIKETIHAIKGISSYGGLNRLYEICNKLEHYHQVIRVNSLKVMLEKEYMKIVNNKDFMN
ncbi:Hpt domain-containing protein [Aliivibrio sp. S4TY2]|uniref:Hpt domain-containing protein n=1 Tax=unclassified Aliivibrio TaxID=2645654 RepID=UPI002377E0D9|nr:MULTISPECIES: Hpt domain-containing protein [unclassified Aliivibrio]MDD9158207.1 Hpt domain-containing protein [Aliivibrio sp. S4TY2]MDD9162122.1 Hpt domain-containing protein [Aliivibrio sp. S4TY1]MDD9166160.1 Hpt domain-containing protein [Aliivibrio sp. S4MY2]MDD9170158.1 Hpt domain-containing protein [Aliivibrio sp. S4MY4]MDD9187197.1 Hpt domain-containing protein [Aliivibrio sp. S4MY3]